MLSNLTLPSNSNLLLQFWSPKIRELEQINQDIQRKRNLSGKEEGIECLAFQNEIGEKR